MTYRTDAKLTESVGTTLNSAGDIQHITQYESTLKQRATLRALNAVYDERGKSMTPPNVENVRDLVETALRNDPVVDEPVTVTASTTGNTVELTVALGERLSISINLNN